MAVKIRLKRMGKIRSPFYRVVVMDSRTKRDGRAIEEIGLYHPTREPSLIEINSERALYWLGVGAQPTEQVQALLKITGDWQKHKGLPGTEGTLKPQPEKPNKRELYEAAMAAAGKADDEHAKNPAPKKKSAKAEAKEAPEAAEAKEAPEAAEAKEAPEAAAAEEAPKAAESAPEPAAEPETPAAEPAEAAEDGKSTAEQAEKA
nr:30S ribosomal protein S16 [Gephyromycinifex aptenodytis]